MRVWKWHAAASFSDFSLSLLAVFRRSILAPSPRNQQWPLHDGIQGISSSAYAVPFREQIDAIHVDGGRFSRSYIIHTSAEEGQSLLEALSHGSSIAALHVDALPFSWSYIWNPINSTLIAIAIIGMNVSPASLLVLLVPICAMVLLWAFPSRVEIGNDGVAITWLHGYRFSLFLKSIVSSPKIWN